MKLQAYESIAACLENGLSLLAVSELFPNVSCNTLISIRAQRYQERAKRSSNEHKQRAAHYWDLYATDAQKASDTEDLTTETSIVWKLSLEKQILPCALAKLLLLQYYESHWSKEDDGAKSDASRRAKEGFRNTALIADPRLRREIQFCMQLDDVGSPYAERVRHCMGAEYECYLQEKIRNLGIPFMNEEDMRRAGYYKTPDIKLQMPITVDGHVVLWIESKASFGDQANHARNLEQTFSYVSRYGPGLLIYWFGYIEEVDEHREKGILIMDHFPPAPSIQKLA